IEFKVSKEVKKFLKSRNFIMFDLSITEVNINFHSIVISKQDWKNFKFVHATDLHLAERNDKIYDVIKNWTESSIKKNVDDFLETAAKKLKIKRKIKHKEEDSLDDIKIPLRKRLINPNNQFRKFIKLANRKVFNNELDFIVLTGDLVDYTVLSRFTKKVRELNEFKYEESNWQVFKNITLNSNINKGIKGVIKGEELLCPIFTTIGNHDYRPYHYDITWAEMYTKIGLNAAEALALNELFSASPITALVKSTNALKGYLSEINSSLDFSLTLGDNNFIFLNTGSDSFKNFRDLITGHPSVTGLLMKQIKYLENLINHKIKERSNVFLFLHGPPINTGEKKFSIKLFEKKGERFIKEKLNDFKESILKKLGQPSSKARLDNVFNVKYGTVSSNWEKLVKFCKDHSTLTLSGHTHSLKEFRLEDPKTKSKVYDSPPFSLKKIENPAAVFYDLYSELYTDAKSIEQHGPFVVQTPALGLGGYKNPETAGAYREIEIKDGKLSSFQVKYIIR
ncbi:MAG: metallophosphoesterase, partial [Candidatus Thorarchaeota archaeon]